MWFYTQFIYLSTFIYTGLDTLKSTLPCDSTLEQDISLSLSFSNPAHSQLYCSKIQIEVLATGISSSSTLSSGSSFEKDVSSSLSFSNPAYSQLDSEIKKEGLTLSLPKIAEESIDCTEENMTPLSPFVFRFKGSNVVVTPNYTESTA